MFPKSVHEAPVEEHAAQEVHDLGRGGSVPVLEREEVVGARPATSSRTSTRPWSSRAITSTYSRKAGSFMFRLARAEGHVEQQEGRDVQRDEGVGDEGTPFRVRGVADRQEHGLPPAAPDGLPAGAGPGRSQSRNPPVKALALLPRRVAGGSAFSCLTFPPPSTTSSTWRRGGAGARSRDEPPPPLLPARSRPPLPRKSS